MDKIKIVFFISDLGGGGAERVLLNILRNIDRSHFIPILFLFKRYGILLSSLPQDIEVYSLKELKGKFWYGFQWLNLLIQFAKHLRKIRPHVVFSLMWYPNAIAILAKILNGLNFKVIVSERTSTFIYESRFVNYLRSLVIHFLYPKADIIISPSKGIAEDLILSYGISKEKIRTAHNPVDLNTIHERAKESLNHPWYKNGEDIIIAVGRLGKEKGFDYLIKAISFLSKNGIDFKLIIIGEGNERKSLQSLAGELNLENRIDFAGFQENPYKYLSRSKIFVLSSIYEGFPNVLLEALSLGVPSIATRCPTGPEEIITDGVDGILVPPANEKALAEAIKRVLLDEALRKRLSESGRKRAEEFRVEKIVKQFEDVIEAVCAESAEK